MVKTHRSELLDEIERIAISSLRVSDDALPAPPLEEHSDLVLNDVEFAHS